MAITRIPTVRKAWYAGSWYAADAPTLRSTISEAVEQAQFWQKRSESESEVHCALVPHAGLAYSARGIAHLLDQRRERVSRVLILGPSHNVVLPDNTLSFGLFSKYETPLGSLDSFSVGLESQGPDATRTLQKEHSVEMVLPFLATLQERQNWPIKVAMALINRVSDASNAERLAKNIFTHLQLGEDEETLIIASSDFSHYGSRFNYAPFGTKVDKIVIKKMKEHDLNISKLLSQSDIGPLFLTQRMGRNTICGIGAASIVSAIAKRHAMRGEIADYYTSLDITNSKGGDFVAYSTILWRR